MKKLLLSSLVALSFFHAHAQSWVNATLDINQVETVVNSNGDLFWNYSNGIYTVPRDSVSNTIFAGAVWIGGFDTMGGLHVAAQTYRQTGDDFYPGPAMNAGSYSPVTDAQWNKVWKINKATIDSFVYACNNAVPGFIIPQSILTWPGNGDVQAGQAAQLAPYVDVNGDGIYDPSACDYPCIKGDQALFFIFNDDRNAHGETGGQKLKVEIHGMMYAYNAPSTWLDSTVFINYKIYNRSPMPYDSMYWGQWTDFDLGYYGDDYIACDVQRNMAYAYNGDSIDGFGNWFPGVYGLNPPAQGVVFLKGPEADANDGIDNDRDGTMDESGEPCMMNHMQYYDGNFTVTGNPSQPSEYYNYIHSHWMDSSHVTYGGTGYGGTVNADFMFPGNSDPLGWGTNFVPQVSWDEVSSGNMPGDRRVLPCSGKFSLQPGQSHCVDLAYVYGRGSNGPLSSVTVLQNNADSAHAFYAQNNPCDCDVSIAGIASNQSASVGVYPNPATDQINIMCVNNSTGAQIEIIDANGKLVHTSTVLSGNSAVVDVSKFTSGIYFVRIKKGSVVLTGKFIRN